MTSMLEAEAGLDIRGWASESWVRLLTKRAYIAQRVADIADLVKEMAEVRDAEAARLKKGDLTRIHAQQAGDRRLYAMMRIRLLKEERARLLAVKTSARAKDPFDGAVAQTARLGLAPTGRLSCGAGGGVGTAAGG